MLAIWCCIHWTASLQSPKILKRSLCGVYSHCFFNCTQTHILHFRRHCFPFENVKLSSQATLSLSLSLWKLLKRTAWVLFIHLNQLNFDSTTCKHGRHGYNAHNIIRPTRLLFDCGWFTAEKGVKGHLSKDWLKSWLRWGAQRPRFTTTTTTTTSRTRMMLQIKSEQWAPSLPRLVDSQLEQRCAVLSGDSSKFAERIVDSFSCHRHELKIAMWFLQCLGEKKLHRIFGSLFCDDQ